MIAALSGRLWILVAANLPVRLAHALAEQVGRLQHRAASTDTLERLRLTLRRRLEDPRDDQEQLLRAISERAAVEQLEGGFFRFKTKRRIASLVEIRGLEAVDRALAAGNGCILYSGHFRGRWTFVAALGVRGYRPMLVRQEAPDRGRLANWFQKRFDRTFSSKFDCRYLWMESPGPFSGALAAAHLRKNGVLVNLIDISTYTQRVVDVPFLGRKEPFPVGPVLLARLTGATLVGFTIRYCPRQRHYVCELSAGHVPSESMEASTASLAAEIEEGVRTYPADWAGWQKSQYIERAIPNDAALPPEAVSDSG